MEVLGFSGEDQDSIFRILASILHLGNVYFEKYEVREVPAAEPGSRHLFFMVVVYLLWSFRFLKLFSGISLVSLFLYKF